MNNHFYKLVSVLSGNEWPEEETYTRCKKTGEALDIVYDYEYIKAHYNRFLLKNGPLSGLKYLDFYPIRDRKQIISLHEGNTPLHRADKLGKLKGVPHLYIKNEGANPTGVFKDRGSLVEITKARELGARGVVVASTGNMAASVSAYAGKAGIPCYVLIPEGTPIGKLAQSLAYGSKILQARGTYDDCVQLTEQMAEKYGYYLAGDYAFRLEGHKSIAFEILEQLGWKAPNAVIVPMGCGTNIAAIWKGFKEFYEFGLVEKTPRMIGVQPIGCSTICAAFEQALDRYVLVEKPNTICSAVGIDKPMDDIKALRALRESQGAVATVDDETILMTQQQMAQIASVFTEPSGAIPVAVLEQLRDRNILSEKDVVVCIECGNGLKDPKSAVMMHATPVSLEPNIKYVDAYLSSGIAGIKSIFLSSRKDVIFRAFPSEQELQEVLLEKFQFHPSAELFEKFREELRGFFEKRSEMRNSELRLFVDEFIAHFGSGETVLSLKDFKIETSLHQKAHASIEILFQGENITRQGSGGGPVDAALTALREALIEKTDFEVHLKDYSVNIPSGGVDVSVVVNIVMVDDKQNKVVGTAASPDVIVASLQAFVNGFNLLWNKKSAMKNI